MAPKGSEDGRRRDNLDPEVRQQISRKGGQAVSQNREHMANIGRKGGEARGNRSYELRVWGRGSDVFSAPLNTSFPVSVK
jgi:uncharacterized protein